MDLGETVGKFLFSATFPNSGIRARFMRSFYARVEHKVVVGVDFVQYAYLYRSNLDSVALWDEAARTDLTRTLT